MINTKEIFVRSDYSQTIVPLPWQGSRSDKFFCTGLLPLRVKEPQFCYLHSGREIFFNKLFSINIKSKKERR